MSAINQPSAEVCPAEASSQAEARATMYTFLANLFNQLPDQALVGRLRSLGSEAIAQLAKALELSEDARLGLTEIARFIEAAASQAEDDVVQALAIDWTRLFRGVAPGYGPPPPYEGVYVGGNVEHEAVLQAVVSEYRQYGVMADDGVNRPDYIGLEFDFLALLAEQEKAAWDQGDSPAALGRQQGARQFMERHAGRWVAPYCERAIPEAKTDFYRGLLRLTRGVVVEMHPGGASVPVAD